MEQYAKNEGRGNGGGNRDYFYYYNNPLKIADVNICVKNSWEDNQLQELLDKVKLGKLDDMRIK